MLSCTAGSPIHQPNEPLAAFAFASSISGDPYVLHQIRCVPLRLSCVRREMGAASHWCSRLTECERGDGLAPRSIRARAAAAWWLLQRGGCSMAAAAAWLQGGSEHCCGCDRGCGAAAAELRLRSCGCGAAAAAARVRMSPLSSSEHVYARSDCVARRCGRRRAH